jgi:hypothetical protein
MPPPRFGVTPSGVFIPGVFSDGDPHGWRVTELEEEWELRPGMRLIAKVAIDHITKLGRGSPSCHVSGHARKNLTGNLYWPEVLDDAARKGAFADDPFVSIIPLALSRTQDDKGRVSWTLFGGSEFGPERVFWKSFHTGPGEEAPASKAEKYLCDIISGAYGVAVRTFQDLSEAGFRIARPSDGINAPSWAGDFIVPDTHPADGLKYLLTFRPFMSLPENFRDAYLDGSLSLLPFPGSLIFHGTRSYMKLSRELPDAMRIPFLRLFYRRCGVKGVRITQSGWFHEARNGGANGVTHELIVNGYHRTHRYNRVQKDLDELSAVQRLEKIPKVVFSTELEDMGLYDKPMARNCQIWDHDFNLILDGPSASPKDISRAEKKILEGGFFGYRFIFPAMRAGRYEVYWHRPLTVCLPKGGPDPMQIDSPDGFLTASPEGRGAGVSGTVELWPRIERRPSRLSALRDFNPNHEHHARETAINISKLFFAAENYPGGVLPRSFARAAVSVAKDETLEIWLESLTTRADSPEKGVQMKAWLEKIIAPPETPAPAAPAPLTFDKFSTREFEESWWKDIHCLAHGEFQNKDNADIVPPPGEEPARHRRRHRDLEILGDYLISRHRAAIAGAGMDGSALCGSLPFKWETDFAFDKFGGWVRGHRGELSERNILTVIPGKNRKEAVILADHYDTAYMEDVHDIPRGGNGTRRAAKGADDNHSATATLLAAAPVYLKLAAEGKLERDIWLLHLTGEEFPSDCMGARYFCRAAVEKRLQLHLDGSGTVDLAGVTIRGVFVMDMIAHNKDRGQDIFQISPGRGPLAQELAMTAHLVNLEWNKLASELNRGPRRGLGHAPRVGDPAEMPPPSAALHLTGEVRPNRDPRSSLYNTDGQIFSDMGFPVVLFMENYDLNRKGYHDTHDTMLNIDLDYGAALAAIAMETAARTAAAP